MKKFLLGLVVLLIVGAVILYSQLDALVKNGMETAGTDVLDVNVAVSSVKLSPFSGAVAVSGLSVAQPQGFGDGSLMQVGDFRMKLDTATLLSDHIIIDEIIIDRPRFDARYIGGKTNFQVLQEKLGAPEPAAETETPITLTIRKLAITGPEVAVAAEGLVNVKEDVKLADFTLTDLGTDEKGLAPKELARHVMDALQPQIAKAMIEAGLGDKVEAVTKDLRQKLEGKAGNLLGKIVKKKESDNN